MGHKQIALRPVSPEDVVNKIFVLRGKKAMLDSDLAALYGVSTKRLNEAVKRNAGRFPSDFMFQLDITEAESLRSQNATSKTDTRGGRRTLPYVFTEQGVSMLSSVLNSKRAIHVNIEIMRAFARIRELLFSHKELQKKIDEMEKKYDTQFRVVFEALRDLLNPPIETKPKKRIGFHSE